MFTTFVTNKRLNAMPRQKRLRRIVNPPHYTGFHPVGVEGETLPILIPFEEYEAIRLSDYELLGQAEASVIMGVSRPTFTRIYESARRKVAQAFVLGRPIVFEGGKVYFDSEWYKCSGCGCWFNHPQKAELVASCPLCGSSLVELCDDIPSDIDLATSVEELCVCSKCGFQKPHRHGQPCKNETCPTCGSPMRRKN